MALGLCMRRFRQLGARPTPRPAAGGGGPFVSDNGNLIVDVALAGAARRCGGAPVPSMPRCDRSRASSIPDCSSQPRNTCSSATRTDASTPAGARGLNSGRHGRQIEGAQSPQRRRHRLDGDRVHVVAPRLSAATSPSSRALSGAWPPAITPGSARCARSGRATAARCTATTRWRTPASSRARSNSIPSWRR